MISPLISAPASEKLTPTSSLFSNFCNHSSSKSNETTISNRLNYVQSTTKKTLIPRFNFLQLEISNVEDDLNNNKLRLLGLGLKYVLLEGLL